MRISDELAPRSITSDVAALMITFIAVKLASASVNNLPKAAQILNLMCDTSEFQHAQVPAPLKLQKRRPFFQLLKSQLKIISNCFPGSS